MACFYLLLFSFCFSIQGPADRSTNDNLTKRAGSISNKTLLCPNDKVGFCNKKKASFFYSSQAFLLPWPNFSDRGGGGAGAHL